MNTIWKYPLEITDYQEIEMPQGARLLHVGLDPAGVPCVWAEVVTDSRPKKIVPLYVVGTGNPVPFGASEHVGSFNDGPFVWHVYKWVNR